MFALALTAATWTTMDARWVIGERKNASQIHAGDTVVLQFAAKESQSDRYLQVADESYTDRDLIIGKGLGIGSAAIIVFEEGPNDIRTDAPTFYMKFLENDMYIKAKYYVWSAPGMTLTSSIDDAAPWQVLSCGEPIPWYDEGNSYTHWRLLTMPSLMTTRWPSVCHLPRQALPTSLTGWEQAISSPSPGLTVLATSGMLIP